MRPAIIIYNLNYNNDGILSFIYDDEEAVLVE